MFRLIMGVIIMIGGLAVLGASAARADNIGIVLGIGFVAVGAIIGGSGGRQ